LRIFFEAIALCAGWGSDPPPHWASLMWIFLKGNKSTRPNLTKIGVRLLLHSDLHW